jgi:hypothetical protein
MRWFGSKKAEATPPAPPADTEAVGESPSELKVRLTQKEIELYPLAIKLLWHYYDPQDAGKEEGRAKEFPGPIDDTVTDTLGELEKVGLLEVIPTFSDFSVTAKLTRRGLDIMAGQSEPGKLSPASITDPGTGAVTVYKEVNLG